MAAMNLGLQGKRKAVRMTARYTNVTDFKQSHRSQLAIHDMLFNNNMNMNYVGTNEISVHLFCVDEQTSQCYRLLKLTRTL